MAFIKTNRAESYEPVEAEEVAASEKKLAGLKPTEGTAPDKSDKNS